MQRFLSAIFALAFAATLSAPAFADTMKSSSMASTKTTCPKGQSWTKGYTKKDGTKVKGYCHADKSAKSK